MSRRSCRGQRCEPFSLSSPINDDCCKCRLDRFEGRLPERRRRNPVWATGPILPPWPSALMCVTTHKEKSCSLYLFFQGCMRNAFWIMHLTWSQVGFLHGRRRKHVDRWAVSADRSRRLRGRSLGRTQYAQQSAFNDFLGGLLLRPAGKCTSPAKNPRPVATTRGFRQASGPRARHSCRRTRRNSTRQPASRAMAALHSPRNPGPARDPVAVKTWSAVRRL